MFKGFMLNQWIQVNMKCKTNETAMQGVWDVAKFPECSMNMHETQGMNFSSELNTCMR